MLTLLGICFGVQWPPSYEKVVEEAREVVNLNVVNLVTIGCFRRWSYHDTLVLRTVAPTVAVALLTIVARLLLCRRSSSSAGGPAAATAQMFLDLREVLLFLCYPSVTATVFQAFISRTFECSTDGADCDVADTFVAADLAIEYDSDAHVNARIYAGFMVAVWPFGVPLYMVIRFWRNRRGLAALAVAEGRHEWKAHLSRTDRSSVSASGSMDQRGSFPSLEEPASPSSKSSSADYRCSTVRHASLESAKEHAYSLLRDVTDRPWIETRLGYYRLRCAWFDAVESLRKLLLTGLAVLFGQGSTGQLVLGVLLASTMLSVTVGLYPYKHAHDNALAVLCQAAVVGSLALGILLKHGRDDSAARLADYDRLGKADLFVDEQAAQAGREEVIGWALIAVAVVPIAVGVVFTVAQLCPRGAVNSGRRGRAAAQPPAAAPQV
jgi:hypothetical protein